MEVLLYEAVYCGLNVVLVIEVPLYRTVYCSPNFVLNTEVSLHFPYIYTCALKTTTVRNELTVSYDEVGRGRVTVPNSYLVRCSAQSV